MSRTFLINPLAEVWAGLLIVNGVPPSVARRRADSLTARMAELERRRVTDDLGLAGPDLDRAL